jgi:enolase
MIIGLILLVLVLLLQAVIKKKYGQDATNVGDEGGFAPNIQVSIVFL